MHNRVDKLTATQKRMPYFDCSDQEFHDKIVAQKNRLAILRETDKQHQLWVQNKPHYDEMYRRYILAAKGINLSAAQQWELVKDFQHIEGSRLTDCGQYESFQEECARAICWVPDLTIQQRITLLKRVKLPISFRYISRVLPQAPIPGNAKIAIFKYLEKKGVDLRQQPWMR
jgi:hypothetical protein